MCFNHYLDDCFSFKLYRIFPEKYNFTASCFTKFSKFVCMSSIFSCLENLKEWVSLLILDDTEGIVMVGQEKVSGSDVAIQASKSCSFIYRHKFSI